MKIRFNVYFPFKLLIVILYIQSLPLCVQGQEAALASMVGNGDINNNPGVDAGLDQGPKTGAQLIPPDTTVIPQDGSAAQPGEVVCLALGEAVRAVEAESFGSLCAQQKMLPCTSEITSPLCAQHNQELVEELFGIDQEVHDSKTLFDLQKVVLKLYTQSDICRGVDHQGTCINALMSLPVKRFAEFMSEAIKRQAHDERGEAPEVAHKFAALKSTTAFVEVGPPKDLLSPGFGVLLLFLMVTFFLGLIGGGMYSLYKKDTAAASAAEGVKAINRWLAALPSSVSATFSSGFRPSTNNSQPSQRSSTISESSNKELAKKLTMLRELRKINTMDKQTAFNVGV